MSSRRDVHGILLVDKPAGVTSAGVVRDVKKRLGGAKVGHLGTLDPFATGLLPLCVGEGAKVVPFLNQESKAYSGTIRLGAATDTLDSTGRVTETGAVPAIGGDTLAEVARRFLGEIEQVPPMYSAVKQEGVPLYRLARKGVTVERRPRRVQIGSLDLSLAGADEIAFTVRCSKGTYVRVLGAEIAASLGTVGHLSSLRRTAFGPFDVARAVAPSALEGSGPLPLLTPREALSALRELTVGAALEERIRRGQQAALGELSPPGSPTEQAKLVDTGGNLVAVVGSAGVKWKLLRVFTSPGAALTVGECRR